MVAYNDKPIVYFATLTAWHDWLRENHDASEGVRVQLVKKSSGKPGISYAETLDEALCWGWIDGQTSSLDDDFFLQSFTRRRPRSVWSKRNRDHVARLTAEGRMQPSGQAQVDAARSDGRWDAAYSQADAVPDDLQAAIDANPAASAFFRTLSGQNRFAIVFRTTSAKRPETRAKRITDFVAMLERGETV